MTTPANGQGFLLNPDAPEGATRYAHARVVPGAGVSAPSSTIYISGIAAVRPEGGYEGVTENADGSFTADIRAQTAAVLARVDEIVRGASAGKATIDNVVDTVVYLTDMKSQYAGMNEEWNKVFKTRKTAPARATIGVNELPDPRFVVEVKAVAIVPS